MIVLLVIDCQNDFFKGLSAYSCQMLDRRLVKNIKKLIGMCRKKNIPVVYTQHSIKKDKSNAEKGEPDDVRACIIGTKGWKIIDEIKPRKDDKIIRKDRYDAFYKTNLEKVLKKLKADTLIICGVLTNNCIRATAEGAIYRGYKLIVVPDCCGATSFIKGITHKKMHELTLNDLKERTYQTDIVKLNDMVKKL